jgi:hypothetical protein
MSENDFQVTAANLKYAVEFYDKKEYSTLNSAMSHILKEASRESLRLISNKDNLTLFSLSVRNLFELFLICRQIYSNEESLHNWYGQSHKDSKDVKNAFIKLAEKKGLDTSGLKEIQEFEDSSLENTPFQSKGGFQIRDLAEKHGYLDDYQFVYKLSSKLVHPSSMKVMAYSAIAENTNYLLVLHHIAVYFGQEFSMFLKGVIEQNA